MAALQLEEPATLSVFQDLSESWLGKELHSSRNFPGSCSSARRGSDGMDRSDLFAGRLPFTLHDSKPDYACLDEASTAKEQLPQPDNRLHLIDSLRYSCPTPTTKGSALSLNGKTRPDPREPAESR